MPNAENQGGPPLGRGPPGVEDFVDNSRELTEKGAYSYLVEVGGGAGHGYFIFLNKIRGRPLATVTEGSPTTPLSFQAG